MRYFQLAISLIILFVIHTKVGKKRHLKIEDENNYVKELRMNYSNNSNFSIYISNKNMNSTTLNYVTNKIILYNEEYFSKSLSKINIEANKFCFLDSVEQMFKSCDYIKKKKNESESDYGVIFLMNDITQLRYLQNLYYLNINNFRENYDYKGIIYANSTDHLQLVNQDINRPVFETDTETFDQILAYLKYNDKKFIELRINYIYDNTKQLMPVDYLTQMSNLAFFISSVTFIIWHIRLIYYRKHIMAIQKVLTILPYAKLLISYLLILYLDQSLIYNDKFTLETDFTIIYLDTAITTLNSIYKTVLWFLIILISNGWKLFIDNFSRYELKKFVTLYLVIYLALCFDQILDYSFNKTFNVKFIFNF